MLTKTMRDPTFFEFFAGGGMARAGLGPGWRCLFANDIDARKAATYTANWGAVDFRVADIHALSARDLPGRADLAWASFPCQDLSLAGAGVGLRGGRSGAFFGLRDLVADLARADRAPKILALENVIGALTSNGGADFRLLIESLDALGYDAGALTIDAARFLPQSRPRLFVVAAARDVEIPAALRSGGAWTSPALFRAREGLPANLRARWIDWALPEPAARNAALIDVIEDMPADVPWHDEARTLRLLSLMAPGHRAQVETRRAAGGRHVGTIYRRTRTEGGRKVQRAEVRFDGLAGCLRTPGGGSSRQFVVVVEGGEARTRLLSGREAARLMGLPEDYRLPARYNDACHLLGDGVAAPVVRHLARHLLEPLIAAL